jgi:tRNA(fMet)-specific endonuclease VapC
LKKYLIDTNICIYYIKGQFELKAKFEKAGPENCFISEITLAELMFGVENSVKKEKNRKTLNNFLTGVKIVPIFHSLDLYAKEKARLRKSGTPIDEFDLLIGVTSVTHNLTMVTNNTDHFKGIKGVVLEDWTKSETTN